jgi:hypothetical protein
MKRNMRTLGVFVISLATIFVMAAMASAGAIKGTYEMIATGSCLHSPSGFSGTGTFTDPFLPIGPVVFAAPTLARATWTFDGSGTATFVGENFATIFPGGVYPDNPLPNPNQGPLERENPIGTETNPYHFDYTVDRHGGIIGTVREIPAIVDGKLDKLTLEGRISTDHKIIILSNGGQIQSPGTGMTAICNSARILFKD